MGNMNTLEIQIQTVEDQLSNIGPVGDHAHGNMDTTAIANEIDDLRRNLTDDIYAMKYELETKIDEKGDGNAYMGNIIGDDVENYVKEMIDKSNIIDEMKEKLEKEMGNIGSMSEWYSNIEYIEYEMKELKENKNTTSNLMDEMKEKLEEEMGNIYEEIYEKNSNIEYEIKELKENKNTT